MSTVPVGTFEKNVDCNTNNRSSLSFGHNNIFRIIERVLKQNGNIPKDNSHYVEQIDLL